MPIAARPARIATALAALSSLVALGTLAACASRGAASASGDEGSHAAFQRVARVLRHPRCLNCHTLTEFPRVGDERARHAMNVQRGPEDRGMAAMRCSTCHQSVNQDLARVPGAPSWHLAPLSMGWEGLDDHALAEALKDPARNGGKHLAELLHHMAEDPLVGWGWDPGAGRLPVPVPRAEVVLAFEEWIDGGAVSPPPGTTSTF
jgi:hypothetical protein